VFGDGQTNNLSMDNAVYAIELDAL
jgi:hypothetical protein